MKSNRTITTRIYQAIDGKQFADRQECLAYERKLATVYVPEVYHFEESKAVIVMRYIEPPHIILRKGFMQGMRFSTLADDLSTFLANTLFGTSAICLDGGTFRSKVAKWSENTGLCALTGNINIFYTYNKLNIIYTYNQLNIFYDYNKIKYLLRL
jgi:5-methylthioribose kinase